MLSESPSSASSGVKLMKAFMLFTGSGPLVVLTSHDAIADPTLLRKFVAKGIDKFIAHEIPLALAKERYGGHFEVVMRDLHETDDLRILDYNGERAFRLFRLAEMGPPILHEPAHS
jgi:hypothetical protein